MSKFFLHTCCAPCGIAVIDELRQSHDLTVFFYNPNIYPEEEYLKRKAEVVKVCEDWKIPMIDGDYETEEWDADTKGMEKEPEGGLRCRACIRMRLAKTVELAASRKADLYGTTLTMGKNKYAAVINPIGAELGVKFGVRFFEADWKKGGRQERARKMVAERGIYRQNYCGCGYSLKRSIKE